MVDEGLEKIAHSPHYDGISIGRATKSGATDSRSAAMDGRAATGERRAIDPRLARLIDARDSLDEATRLAIVAMVEGAA